MCILFSPWYIRMLNGFNSSLPAPLGQFDHWKFRTLITRIISHFDQICFITRTVDHFDQTSFIIRTIGRNDQIQIPTKIKLVMIWM